MGPNKETLLLLYFSHSSQAATIRADGGIKGVLQVKEEQKMFLYAYDNLLLVKDSAVSILNVLFATETYGKEILVVRLMKLHGSI